jgi:hypothetical protein
VATTVRNIDGNNVVRDAIIEQCTLGSRGGAVPVANAMAATRGAT